MPKGINVDAFIGKKYGLYTVLSFVERRGEGNKARNYFLCKCECGTERTLILNKLRRGENISCGCIQKPYMSRAIQKYGQYIHGIRSVFNGIVKRCTVPSEQSYPSYGGRGIKICEEWRNNFETFYDWCIDNGWGKGRQIDRRDNDGDYCPINCRFVDRKTNTRNTRRNRIITYEGVTKTLVEWSETTGINYSCLRHRLSKNWPLEKVFSQESFLGVASDNKKKKISETIKKHWQTGIYKTNRINS